MVQSYLTLRERVDETGDFQYTCARTLLSIIRISMALVKLNLKKLYFNFIYYLGKIEVQ